MSDGPLTPDLSLDRSAKINELHDELLGLANSSIQKAMELGELLCSQKAELQHGQWIPWCEQNLCFSERTARRYMRLHGELGKSDSLSDLSLSEAYQRLAHVEPTELRSVQIETVAKADASTARFVTIAPRPPRTVTVNYRDIVGPPKCEIEDEPEADPDAVFVPVPEWKQVANQFETLAEQDRAAFVSWLLDHCDDITRRKRKEDGDG